jgi:hypothetical protein
MIPVTVVDTLQENMRGTWIAVNGFIGDWTARAIANTAWLWVSGRNILGVVPFPGVVFP